MEQARGTSQLPTFSIIYGLENTLSTFRKTLQNSQGKNDCTFKNL